MSFPTVDPITMSYDRLLSLLTTLALGVFLATASSMQAADDAATASARASFATLSPMVARSVVMVRVAAHPQMRVRGVIQPPRTFDLEGPASVVAAGGLVASSLSVFDPIKGFPPRDGVDFGTTVYSKVEILVDGATWIEGAVAASSESDDLIFFKPANAADAERLTALPSRGGEAVAAFDEFFDITRAPAAFERCLIARSSTIAGVVSSGHYIFASSLSVGSPVVDREGRFVGLGVRVPTAGLPSTSVLIAAPRLMEIAKDKGVLAEAAAQ